uniref:Putative secreted protein n=1 Tax=Anopheles darlingi TaxID=43151 RepID=A0A2M4DGR1_ANODA
MAAVYVAAVCLLMSLISDSELCQQQQQQQRFSLFSAGQHFLIGHLFGQLVAHTHTHIREIRRHTMWLS